MIRFNEVDIKDVILIDCFSSKDERGIFIKDYERNVFLANGIDFTCSETFYSYSDRNVIRGLHFQLYHPQKKIISVINGEIMDVVVDLRKNSETYGKYKRFFLKDTDCKAIYIPKGCAHGFCSLSNNSIVLYKCDGKYDKQSDTGIVYNDISLKINWPKSGEEYIVSDRDKDLMSFEYFDKECNFTYE